MILTRLKEATRDQHEELERVFDPTVRAFTPGDYRRLPARLYGFYEPLEARLGALPDWSAAGFDFSRRRKTPLLVRDLQSLGWRAGDIECLPRRRNLPRVDGFGRALGALYVVEGAMLGGQIPSRHFKTTLDLTPVNGAAFYAGYGAETGVR